MKTIFFFVLVLFTFGSLVFVPNSFAQQVPFANVPFDTTNIPEPVPPPAAVRAFFQLDSYYQQWINVRGFPVLASAEVSPYALKEVAWLIGHMIGHRPDVLKIMAQNKARFSIVPHNKHLPEIPEYDFGRIGFFWEMRARGVGGRITSSPEENIICGDRNYCYAEVIHEFAHQIHDYGLGNWGIQGVDPTFDKRLKTLYNMAKKEGLYQNRYAGTNRMEYWAEGVGSWFNGPNKYSNVAHTRSALKEYDPRLAELLTEVHGDGNWRYTPPATRTHLPHLQGFNPQDAPIYQRPARLLKLEAQLRDPNSDGDGKWVNLKLHDPSELPRLRNSAPRNNSNRTETDLIFVNLTGTDLSLYFFDANGRRNFRQHIDSSNNWHFRTWVGAIWLLQDHTGKDFAVFRAEEQVGRVLIRTRHQGNGEADNSPEVKISDPNLEADNSPEVRIPDPNLAAAVRKALGLTSNAPITDSMMQRLTELNASDVGITNIVGLEHATQLTWLNLGRNQIKHFDPLAQLSKLKRLFLWANGINDLNVLPPMPQLEFLDLNWNDISDLSPLAKFTSLKELWLQGNKLADTSTLFQLHNGTFPPREEVKIVKERDRADRAYTLLILQSLDLKVRVNPDATVYRSLNAVQNARQPVTTTNVVVEEPTPATNVVVEEGVHPPIYWINTETGALHRLVDTEVDSLVPRVRNANSLAVDVGGGKLYWTERTSDNTGMIRRANLDGTNVQLVKDLTSVLHGIALDTTNGKIYLTNAWGKVQRLNVDGSNFQPNLITGLDTPRGLALDVSGGKVYWTEMPGRIRRANLDGSNVQDIAIGLGTPMDLVVFDGTVYWTEMTGENQGEIQRVNLDRTAPEMLLTLTSVPHGIAIDPMESKLYWTNSRGKIQRANLDGSDFQPNLVMGLTSPGSIAVEVKPKEILATDALLSISPSPVMSPTIGDRLTLNVNITAGAAVAGYQVTVQFDTTALRYIESSNGDYLPDGAFFLPPVVKRNRVELASSTLTGVSNGDGTLATITFEVLAVKASTLTLSDMLLADSQGNTFRPQVEMGEVTEPPKLKADINGDGVVNIQDLVLVASNFGKTGPNAADVNADGIVNIADLVLVAGSLGTGLGAPSLHPSALEMLTAAEVQEWLSQAHQLDSDYAGYQRGLLVLEHLLAALIPKETNLLPNYPNPFNPETWIPYQLSKSADVTLHIYAANGVLVRTLTLGHQPAGIYQNRRRAAYWDGRNELGEKVASGIYFYTLSAGDFTATRKMLIMK